MKVRAYRPIARAFLSLSHAIADPAFFVFYVLFCFFSPFMLDRFLIWSSPTTELVALEVVLACCGFFATGAGGFDLRISVTRAITWSA